MGLFGKLFDKKECDICGGEIGLLGNRKLADGNLCKNCAQKLSPFMTDRRTSTVEEIRQHLNYREQNAQRLGGFHPTRTFGTRTKVYLDENQGKFIVSRSTNWRDQNPDIIDINQVIDCAIDVKEHKQELYRENAEGKRESYKPPRFEYEYEFRVTIKVDSPYFDEIEFELTDARPERRFNESYRGYEQEGRELQQALKPGAYGVAQPAAAPQAAAPQTAPSAQAAPGQWVCSCGQVNTGKFCIACGSKQPARVVAFRCDKCGWTPDDPAHPPKFCPNCGDPFDMRDAQ